MTRAAALVLVLALSGCMVGPKGVALGQAHWRECQGTYTYSDPPTCVGKATEQQGGPLSAQLVDLARPVTEAFESLARLALSIVGGVGGAVAAMSAPGEGGAAGG